METDCKTCRTPRRSPRQSRSKATVDAIFQATIQVLERHDFEGLTTTRVARRAGVSVGTFYQYYPNKDALLIAVMVWQLSILAAAIERGCEKFPGEAGGMIAENIVNSYLYAKMAQARVSPALYRAAKELDARDLIEASFGRSLDAIKTLLCRLDFANPELTAKTLTAALFGTVPAFCERVLSPDNGAKAQEQLTVMLSSYLAASPRTT